MERNFMRKVSNAFSTDKIAIHILATEWQSEHECIAGSWIELWNSKGRGPASFGRQFPNRSKFKRLAQMSIS